MEAGIKKCPLLLGWALFYAFQIWKRALILAVRDPGSGEGIF
jgi:hypothetical protein